MPVGATVYHPVFDAYGTVEDVGPRSILVRWDTRTVTRTTSRLTPHHSHVYERSIRLVRP